MTITLDKINKIDGQKFTQDDIVKIDNNATKIENAINNIPSSGSTVTSSTTNGNIKIDGNETTVYTHPTGATSTNPHGTTASDVGLGNVTNESKTTMFTNPVFTGLVIEGNNTSASGSCSHAEGQYTLADNGTLYKVTAFNDVAKTITLDNVTGLVVGNNLDIFVSNTLSYLNIPITAISGLIVTLNTTKTLTANCKYAIKRASTQYPTHSEGYATIASGVGSHAEGYSTVASGQNSHAEGYSTTANNLNSHAEGGTTTASGSHAHAEGGTTTASGNYAHAEGYSTVASGSCSHAEGSNTIASGQNSHAEGQYTTASGNYAHAEGDSTTGNVYLSHVMGQYNKVLNGSATTFASTNDAFVIGCGLGSATLANAFRVNFAGATYGLSAFNSSGADLAEFHEWQDQNLNKEDRVGCFVTNVGKQIKMASANDVILGVISGNPCLVGNSDNDDWNSKYLRDDFNRIIYEDVEEEIQQIDEETNETTYIKTGNIIKNGRMKLNPEWDSTKDYVSREDRPEWDYVCKRGMIPVRDDGTCIVNSWCKCEDNGIATLANERGFDTFMVLERITENIVLIEFR